WKGAGDVDVSCVGYAPESKTGEQRLRIRRRKPWLDVDTGCGTRDLVRILQVIVVLALAYARNEFA
ncbi:hypothetical protein, partial [Klebsiella pneumoniae]|uniref:hypothetical protein n=1 Tax=Klebsiella pneumoniae TaxID=573 RepID=UPI0030135E77